MDVGAPRVGETGVGTSSGCASSILVRDRGRWWSEEDRMKGNFDSRPLAPEVLRLRVTGGLFDDALDVSAPSGAEL
jgi:hypothetical protein